MKFRLALAYAAIFAIIGIHQPYWPLWLQYNGLGPVEIAALTAITFALKIVATPVAGRLADRTGRKRSIMILLAAGMALGVAAFFAATGFVAILFVTLFAFACWSPLMSLLDSMATLEAKANGFDYGRIRLWGSISLLIITALTGCLVDRAGAAAVLPALALACVLALLAMFLLPQDTNSTLPTNGGRTLWLFASSDWFPLFILSTMLIQGSHGALYAFGSLSWKAHGISDGIIGALWALSVCSEIGFFAFGRPLSARFSSSSVIALGGALAAVRWFLLATFAGNIVVTALAQILHGVTFGASHLAAMRLISTLVDDSISASAQGLYSAVILGVGMGAFIFTCGPLYALLGIQVFDVMAATAALGAILALALKHRPFTFINQPAFQVGRSSS